MPSRRYLPPVLPPGSVQAAFDVLNLTPIRLEILRDLALHPEGSTTVEVAARIEADYRTVWSHLKLLRAKNVVTDEQAPHRIGPLYRINLQALRAHFDAALAYASGADGAEK